MAPESCAGGPGILGVLGGMGPLATVDFLHKVLAATPGATTDQQHVPVLVSNIPQMPDRNAAFRGEGESPLDAMVANGRRLGAAGAELVVMPCNTAHLWFDALRNALGLPMIHIVDAALAEVAGRPGARVGLLATHATLAAGLYVKRGPNVQWLLPTAAETREHVMPGIAAVKAGDMATGAVQLTLAAQGLARRGATVLLLGCTEIPLALDAARAGLPVVDATAALARAAVAWALRGRRRTMPV